MPNYNMLPEHFRDGMKRYIENGIIPGNFLQAVICNDLKKSVWYADNIDTILQLSNCINFFHWEIPGTAWGSKEKMEAWAGTHRKEIE